MRTVLLLSLSCLLLPGCVSAVSRAAAPSVVVEKVLSVFVEAESVLVLPVWRQLPFFYTENRDQSSIRYYVDKPLVLGGTDLKALSSRIPVKKSRGLVGVAFQFGRQTQFIGVYLMSPDGHLVWMENNMFPDDPQWVHIKEGWLGSNWRQVLSENMARIQVTTPSDESLLGAISWPKGNKVFSFSFTEKEKTAVRSFVRNVVLPEDVCGDQWYRFEVKSGSSIRGGRQETKPSR